MGFGRKGGRQLPHHVTPIAPFFNLSCRFNSPKAQLSRACAFGQTHWRHNCAAQQGQRSIVHWPVLAPASRSKFEEAWDA